MSQADLPDPEERIIRSYSPEARREEAAKRRRELGQRVRGRVGPGTRFFEVVKRVAVGAYNDGFIHAGNLAYMAMLAIFPFFITGAAIFSAIGEEAERAATINAILFALPPVVGNVIEPVARSVIEARSGWLLWIGGLFGLWTVGSLIETIRDILRRAYGTVATHSFLKYRLLSTGIIISAVILLLVSLIAQVLIGTAQEIIQAYIPQFADAMAQLSISRIVPALGLFGSIYLLFYTLTPAAYRTRRYPKWPGALLVTVWWVGVTIGLPPVLRSMFSYDLTYGSMAGIMITLFFFWLVGLGMVVGAELNAALAEPPEEVDFVGQADNRKRAALKRAEAGAGNETEQGGAK
ncbi:YihY/virulence factor BrkB family protein [Altererythrobacter aquiaggeris]|uniref:YihY/virulence factor BrkB family protein n=1 Tax=Aestuarierythrobacter aquiaggeris TaxID=1898396 RepID=UPI003018A8EB